ncbi:tyrosine-type recombinase/integrase [Massilia sp. BHUDP2]|uniref:tyrosine-type recombinase/integrase n=1 Tax=Massilia sp. BHUDP2 TaxID=3034505 RepID=UPI0039057927
MGRARLAKNRALPANLYQNPAGYFYYRNPETKAIKGLGKERAKAMQEARAANAALAGRERSSLVDWVLGKSDYTLREWIPIYRELWETKKKPSASTLDNAVRYLRKAAESDLGARRMAEITTAHVARFIEAHEKDSGAAATHAMRTRLSDLFRWAETQGVIEVGKNPVSATFTPTYKVKRERLTLEQFWQIHAQANAWLQRAMMLALTTAQRRDDITKMKFADFKDGFLHVAQGKSKGEVKLQLDGAIRLAKIGVSIGEAVAACRDLIVSRYMIHHVEKMGKAKPGDQLAAGSLSEAFQRAREKAGIQASDGRTPPTFHEIRSLSERLYREEFGAAFAQSILGHKNAAMTDRYDDLRGGWLTVSAK